MKIFSYSLLACLALLAAAPSVAAAQPQPGKNTKTAAMLERLKKLPTATAKDDAPPVAQSKPQKSDATGKTDRKIAKLLKGDPSKTDLAEQQLSHHALTAASLQLKESGTAGNGMSNFSSTGSTMHTNEKGTTMMEGSSGCVMLTGTNISSLTVDSGGTLAVRVNGLTAVGGGTLKSNSALTLEGTHLFTIGDSSVVELSADFLASVFDNGKVMKIGDLEARSLAELQALADGQKLIFDDGKFYIHGPQK